MMALHWYFSDEELKQDGDRNWPGHMTFAQRKTQLIYEIEHGLPGAGNNAGRRVRQNTAHSQQENK